jgi:hypothetical protein
MENQNLLILFIAITSAAVVIQAGILIALYLSVRKSTARMEALSEEVRTKALPAIDGANALVTSVRPRIELIAENVSESTLMVRSQIQQLDATLREVLDRTRLQVIRADEMVGRALDKVEETTDVVQRTVVSPFRQVTGIMQGVSAGLDYFMHHRKRQRGDGMGVPQDEMFI